MRCKACGNEISDGSKFCLVCGRPVEDDLNNNNLVSSSANMTNENNNLVPSSSGVDNNVNEQVNGNVDLNQNRNIGIENNIGFNQQVNNEGINNQINNSITNSNVVSVYGNNNTGIGPSVASINSSNINNQNIMNNGITNNITNNEANSTNRKQKKKSFVPIMIIIIIVLILGCLAVCGYFILTKKSSSKSIFMEGLNKVANFNSISNNNIALSESIKLNINSSDSNISEYAKIINNMDLVIDYKKNDSEKAIDGILKVNYKGDNAINVGGYIRENDLYLSLDGLYDKYINIPSDENIYEEISNVNYDIIKKSVINAMDKSLKEEYFKKSKETIIVNNKGKDVTSHKLVIDSKNRKAVVTDYTNALVSDEEFINYIATVSKRTSAEVKKELIDSLKSVDETTNNSIVEISIYTSGLKNDFEGFSINLKSSNEYSISVLKIDSENYDLIVNYNGVSFTGKINYVEKNKERKANIKLNFGTTDVELNINIIELDDNTVKKINKTESVSTSDFISNSIEDVASKAQSNAALTELINDIRSIISVYDNYQLQL